MVRFHQTWLCSLLAFVVFTQPIIAQAGNPFEAMIDVVHNAKRHVAMSSPDDVSNKSVEQVASEIDWLEHKVETFGTVVPKQPDVWGEARLTMYRQEVETELKKRLDKFGPTLQGSIRRSDQSFLSAALAIDAASGVNGGDSGGTTDFTGLASEQITQILTSQNDANAARAEASKAQAEAHKAIIESVGKASDELIQGTNLGGYDLKASSFATKTISLEPTVFNNQLDHYLKALNQLRRINEGDDTSDAPGYSLHLVRVPVSVLPGKMTRKGYGAEVSLTAQPHITDELLPSTMRSLIVNDVVSMHSLSVSQQLLNDPHVTRTFAPTFTKADIQASEWMRVYDAWLSLWIEAIQYHKLNAPGDINGLEGLQARFQYYNRIREYIHNRLLQIAGLEDDAARPAVEIKITSKEIALLDLKNNAGLSKLFKDTVDYITIKLGYAAVKIWANNVLNNYEVGNPVSVLRPCDMKWEFIVKFKDSDKPELPIRVVIPIGMKNPIDYSNETVSLTPPFQLFNLDKEDLNPVCDAIKNKINKVGEAELKKREQQSQLSKKGFEQLGDSCETVLLELAKLESYQSNKFIKLSDEQLSKFAILNAEQLKLLSQLEYEELARLSELDSKIIRKATTLGLPEIKRLAGMIEGDNPKASTRLLQELDIPSAYIREIQSIDLRDVPEAPETKSKFVDLLVAKTSENNNISPPLLRMLYNVRLESVSEKQLKEIFNALKKESKFSEEDESSENTDEENPSGDSREQQRKDLQEDFKDDTTDKKPTPNDLNEEQLPIPPSLYKEISNQKEVSPITKTDAPVIPTCKCIAPHDYQGKQPFLNGEEVPPSIPDVCDSLLELFETQFTDYLTSFYNGAPSADLDTYHHKNPCEQPIRLLSEGISAGALAPQIGASDRPLPPSMYVEVIGAANFFRMATAAHYSIAAGAAADETGGYLDIRRLITEETKRAYDWLNLEGHGAWARFATPELATAIRRRDFVTINRLHREFDFFTSGNSIRSITATLAWSILVDAALLNEKLIKDMRRVSREKGCSCLYGDHLTFVGPEELLTPDAQAAWKEYVSCRWPIQVYALDPVGEDQNIADQFSRRRELQLALAVGVAQGNVRASVASRFARQLETDIETIALNRVAVGFSHGSDTFGWRFYPRLQTPDTPGTLGAFWETVAGGPDLDADLRDRGLEPGIRECTAIVLMPSFVPHVTLDSRASWFSITNPRRKVLTMKDTMKISRNYQAVRRSLNFAQEGCAYRPGDVSHLTRVVDQIERRLPLQHMLVPLPFENTLGGFQMFRAGITDLAPEVYGWYGAPGIKIAADPTHKTKTETEQTIDKTKITTTVEAEKSGPPTDTMIFLVGSRFSVHDTQVIAGGKKCDVDLLSREIMRVKIPADVKTVRKYFAKNCLEEGDKEYQDYVDLHLATPYGITSHMLIKALDKPDTKSESATAAAIAAATQQVDKLDQAVKDLQRSLPVTFSDEPVLQLVANSQPNGMLVINPALGVQDVTANLVNESGHSVSNADIEMAIFDPESGKYISKNISTGETISFAGTPSGAYPETGSKKFKAMDLVRIIRGELRNLTSIDFEDKKKELLVVLFIKHNSWSIDRRLRPIGKIRLELQLN